MHCRHINSVFCEQFLLFVGPVHFSVFLFICSYLYDKLLSVCLSSCSSVAVTMFRNYSVNVIVLYNSSESKKPSQNLTDLY